MAPISLAGGSGGLSQSFQAQSTTSVFKFRPLPPTWIARSLRIQLVAGNVITDAADLDAMSVSLSVAAFGRAGPGAQADIDNVSGSGFSIYKGFFVQPALILDQVLSGGTAGLTPAYVTLPLPPLPEEMSVLGCVFAIAGGSLLNFSGFCALEVGSRDLTPQISNPFDQRS